MRKQAAEIKKGEEVMAKFCEEAVQEFKDRKERKVDNQIDSKKLLKENIDTPAKKNINVYKCGSSMNPKLKQAKEEFNKKEGDSSQFVQPIKEAQNIVENKLAIPR